jgi:hypothetical protein
MLERSYALSCYVGGVVGNPALSALVPNNCDVAGRNSRELFLIKSRHSLKPALLFQTTVFRLSRFCFQRRTSRFFYSVGMYSGKDKKYSNGIYFVIDDNILMEYLYPMNNETRATMKTQEAHTLDTAEAMLFEAESLLMEVLGDNQHIKKTEDLLIRIREYKKQRGLV